MKTMLEKIGDLVLYLNECNRAYDEGKPIISDGEYDKLYFELMDLEKMSGIYLSNSPTQNINYQIVNELKKVKHNHPMLSLDKTKDWNEFLQYFNSIDASKSVVAMLKLDGLTCTLEYENGKLIGAETRGNGEIGEDILHNALVIHNIPNRINCKERLIVDGEIICNYKDFESFSKEYANPRNFAAGSIRLLDAKECEKRNLSFIAWHLVEGGTGFHIDNLNLLNKLGFEITPWVSSFDWDAKEYLIETAEDAGYPIDGLVGRFNDIQFGESLGATSHHSRAAYAFKFGDQIEETELWDIEWTMGRTGILTPVAFFKPIDLEGTTVCKASLHNVSVMKELLGDHPHKDQLVKVYKSNMIIPQIYEADKTSESSLGFSIPSKCPICGGETKIIQEISSQMLYCTNPQCEGKLVNKLDHYCGKKGLEIKGLSVATLGKLIEWGWVKSIKDIYKLNSYKDEWPQKEGFGKKSVENILNAIENSKVDCELHKFIAALGIPLVGTTAAKDLANEFKTWDNFIKAVYSNFKFYNLPNFGVETHNKIHNFNFAEAEEISEFIQFKSIEDKKDNKLENLTFSITGKLKHFKNRDELKKVIEDNGGKVNSSISKNTDYLINNDVSSNSTKNNTAKKLNIPILSEEDFFQTFGITY
jgi:DNA ligase (NAD+)